MSLRGAKKLGVKETLVQVSEEGLPKEVRRQVVCRPVSILTYVDMSMSRTAHPTLRKMAADPSGLTGGPEKK